jgi:hypothetical protein
MDYVKLIAQHFFFFERLRRSIAFRDVKRKPVRKEDYSFAGM